MEKLEETLKLITTIPAALLLIICANKVKIYVPPYDLREEDKQHLVKIYDSLNYRVQNLVPDSVTIPWSSRLKRAINYFINF